MVVALLGFPEPPSQWIVLHKNPGEGIFQGFCADGFPEKIEVFDGESEELLIVEIGEVKGVILSWGFRGDQRWLVYVGTIWELGGFEHGGGERTEVMQVELTKTMS